MGDDLVCWKFVLATPQLNEIFEQRAKYDHVQVWMITQIQLVGPKQQQVRFSTTGRAAD
ncbi:hypothetical protein D3C71_2114300 [compost metagenome]